MADKIVHYEVTKGYSKAKEGLRFDVMIKGGHNKPFDTDINKALAEELGISLGEASGIRSHLEYEEI